MVQRKVSRDAEAAALSALGSIPQSVAEVAATTGLRPQRTRHALRRRTAVLRRRRLPLRHQVDTQRGWFVTDMAEAGRSFHWAGCQV